MKKQSISFDKLLQKSMILFVTAAMIFQCLFSAQAVKAAEVTLPYNGTELKTTVSGYIGTTDDGNYVIKEKLVYNIIDPDTKQFNKYTMVYTASDAIKGTFSYLVFGNVHTETFFLEKGESVTFASLLDTSITVDSKVVNNVMGSKPLQLTFEPAKEEAVVAFKLQSIDINIGYRPVNDTVYIENDRFKLGVYMAWGGGVNYIEDKLDGDDTVTNMLNSYDAGRLVQQSYYGTTKKPYVVGNYQGNPWGYNPVQGGDQFNNRSKILDFKIEENSIYVKCRPLDWSQRNSPTFSYMENTYTLYEDYIEVDNRFIDFSNYDHGDNGRHQELPAFYTISYLDTFTFYNGKKPWTDDKLTEKKDLPFWAEEGSTDKCYTILDKANTETWCAWISSEKGYGIGLYTPQVEMLLAGRCEYDGSKNPKAFPTNYVAPLVSKPMENFKPFEYTYIISTGDVNSMRKTFKEHKDDFNWKETLDYTYLTFNKSIDIKAFSKASNCNVDVVCTGMAKITATGKLNKPECNVMLKTSLNPTNILTSDYSHLTLTYMVPKTNSKDSYTSRLYFYIGSTVEADKKHSIPVELKCDGQFHTEIINLRDYEDIWPSKGNKTTGLVKNIRFDCFEDAAANDKMYLSCFALAADEATAKKYGENAVKTDPATFDAEMLTYTPAPEADVTPQAEIVNPNADTVTDTIETTPATDDTDDTSTNWGKILIFAGIGAVAVAGIVITIVVVSLKKVKKSEAEDKSSEEE